MKMNRKLLVGLGALSAALAFPVLADTLIKNPSFENSIPATWPYYGSIDDWITTGQVGINEGGGPFHNNGTPIPDGRRIGFHQGPGTVAQDISGLVPGKRYWIQFRYDARQGSDLDIAVKFSTVNWGGAMDETLTTILKPQPAILTSSPYYFKTVPVVPDADTGTLTFDIATRGDSTANLDAVTMVQRDEGSFVVINPSFEASGTVYDGAPMVGTGLPAISGWAKNGIAGVDDGTGGQADNGAIPEQALVAFIEGAGSLAQTLSPLVPADNYEVSFAYNAKSGTAPHLQVLVDGAVIWEKDVTPVGGSQPYAKQTVTFKAAAANGQLMFSNTVAGATVLLDEIKIAGKTGTALSPMVMEPAKTALRVGDEAICRITIPIERLSEGPAAIRVRSANTGIFMLPDADTNGVVTLNYQGTTTVQTFKVRGTGVGNARVDITDASGVPFPTDITMVFVAANTLVLNPSFEVDKDSGVGNAPVTGWTTGGANIGMAAAGNPFLSTDDFTAPDRRQVLRIQGGGGTVSQLIKNLKVGQLYGLQFFYNGRFTGYPYKLALQVSFAGQPLASIPEILPASLAGLTDYYFKELRFTPTATEGLLEFKTVVTEGDATLFLDGISIVPRVADEVSVMNSSFEASPMGANWPGYFHPERPAGWIATGGYGVNGYSPSTYFVEPFFDNGINPDQDNVFFGQGGVSIRQTVAGLTTGQTYTLVVSYNYRDGRGQNDSAPTHTGQLKITVDGADVLETAEQEPVDAITPYPGYRHTKPFYQAFVPIVAAGETAEIMFTHTGIAGDETYLLDGVRMFPGTRTPPSITKELADQIISTGGTATFTTAANGTGLSYRWFQEGVELKDGNGITGSTTANLTLANAQVSQSGTYSVLVSDGVGIVGSTALLTVEAPPVSDVTLAARLAGGKIVISWPVAASGYRLQRAPTMPPGAGGWTDESTPAVENGDNWEVSIDPAGDQRYFRLIK